MQTTPKIIWNASASAPVGLYWVLPDRSIARGDLVLATLPDAARILAAERNYLPANVPLVKRVDAIAGDTVCGIGMTVTVDGREVAERLPADGQGQALPVWQGCRVLASNEVFLLMEAVLDSFDGRYFGPVETRRIIGRLVPLWTR
jgi:conjugative transfer signal peptidase TraF